MFSSRSQVPRRLPKQTCGTGQRHQPLCPSCRVLSARLCGTASRFRCALQVRARCITSKSRNVTSNSTATPADTSTTTNHVGINVVAHLLRARSRGSPEARIDIPPPLASYVWATTVVVFLTVNGLVSLYPDLQEPHRGLLIPVCDRAPRPVTTLWARRIDGGSIYARVILGSGGCAAGAV